MDLGVAVCGEGTVVLKHVGLQVGGIYFVAEAATTSAVPTILSCIVSNGIEVVLDIAGGLLEFVLASGGLESPGIAAEMRLATGSSECLGFKQSVAELPRDESNSFAINASDRCGSDDLPLRKAAVSLTNSGPFPRSCCSRGFHESDSLDLP